MSIDREESLFLTVSEDHRQRPIPEYVKKMSAPVRQLGGMAAAYEGVILGGADKLFGLDELNVWLRRHRYADYNMEVLLPIAHMCLEYAVRLHIRAERPGIQTMARQAARDLELACDNRVVAGASPVQRRAYARTLLAALETASASTTSLSTPWQGGSSMMKQRFHNLFSPIPRRRGRMLPAIALAAVLCLGGLVSCSSGPQTTLPQEPTDLQALPHLQYTARPGMLIKDAQLTTPFCLSPTDTADASGAPAEQMIPLADAQPLKQGDVVLIVGSIGSHYQVILPALDPPFLEGTLPQSAVSTDPGQFAQANLGTVGADTPCYLTPEDTSAVSVFSDPCLVSVSSRAGGWAKVQAPGGGAPVWVRSQDLSYDFTWTGRTVDLSQLTV